MAFLAQICQALDEGVRGMRVGDRRCAPAAARTVIFQLPRSAGTRAARAAPAGRILRAPFNMHRGPVVAAAPKQAVRLPFFRPLHRAHQCPGLLPKRCTCVLAI